MGMSIDRIVELERRIADLKKNWPAHSIPPAMMERLDELEDELRQAREGRSGSGESTETDGPVYRLRAIGYVENQFDEPVAAEQIRAG